MKPSDLRYFQNHSSQMAALDYLVSLESDIFIPTYDGNMAKVVEGHRRWCFLIWSYSAVKASVIFLYVCYIIVQHVILLVYFDLADI